MLPMRPSRGGLSREILGGPVATSGFLLGEGMRSTSMDSTLSEADEPRGWNRRGPLGFAEGVEAVVFPVLKAVCCDDLTLCSCSTRSVDFLRDSSN